MGKGHVVAMSITALASCVASGGGPVLTHPAEATGVNAAQRGVARQREHTCESNSRSERSGTGWTAIAFDKWSEFSWVFVRESSTGEGVLWRVFEKAEEPRSWRAKASSNHLRETGVMKIETKEPLSLVRKTKISVHLTADAHSGVGELEESLRFGEGDVRKGESEVVVFVNEMGNFWSKLERMHQCNEQALEQTK